MIYSTRRFVLCLALCFSVHLALRLPRLGKRELILVLFVRLFDFRWFGFCLFPLPLDVWEGLQFVIVALPGLFSYLFFFFFLDNFSLTYDPVVMITTFFRGLLKEYLLAFTLRKLLLIEEKRRQ